MNHNTLRLEEDERYKILEGDAVDRLKDISSGIIDCIFTSPGPIISGTDFLRTGLILGDYAKRVLKPNGSMWVHLEDSFDENGSLRLIPSDFARHMKKDRKWIIRSERIWHMSLVQKPNQVRTNVIMRDRDGNPIDDNRPVMDHSYLYLFTNGRYGYFFDSKNLPGLPCTVFNEQYIEPKAEDTVSTGFSEVLIAQSLVLSCPNNGIVLDPFAGTGTTGVIALKLGYKFIGIERDPEQAVKLRERLEKSARRT